MTTDLEAHIGAWLAGGGMILLRQCVILACVLVVAFMAHGAASAVTGKEVRRGDPMRLGVVTTFLLIGAYNVRAMMAPDSITALASLHLLSIANAAYVLRLGYAYGRGPKL